MNQLFTNFAVVATESGKAAQSPGILGALGINLKLFITQLLAFLILVAVLGKFVYPFLVKSIDDRRETIDKSLKEAKAVQEASEKSESNIQKLLTDARTEADDIIARSHAEAVAQVAEAEEKARSRSEQIVRDAHTQLEADLAKARVALKKDTAALVALATERVLREKIDSRKDAEIIDRALNKERA